MSENNEFSFENPQYRKTYWHTCSHVMAQAVKRLWPEVKLAIGPSIDNGFYYDFDAPFNFTQENLDAIEAEMRKICKEKLKLERFELPREEAIKYMEEKNEPYKVELINDLPLDAHISFYTQGEFTDLCAGPHLDSTGRIKGNAIKLTQCCGAYWRGDSTKEMLQRIYATAWADKKDLKAYLEMLEEAEKRDHRKLGREMDLFHFEPEYAPGAVFWHDKGYKIYRKLIEYMRNRQEHNGYIEIATPRIMDRVLWEISGHWDKYGAHNYSGKTEDEKQFCVKPMNCPGGLLVYKQGIKSYRDLPLRLFEFGTVYRYEQSGELHGLTRVRGFTQDDAHLFVRPDQLLEEFERVIDIVLYIFKTLKFDNYTAQISLRDPNNKEKYIGSDENWEKAESAIMQAAKEKGLTTVVELGEAAFYGPKLDFMVKDAIGRKWQLGTIQVDYNLPERFDLTYKGADDRLHRPIMIHRAPFGSMERFVAVLLEHTGGKFPLWLSPQQVVVLPISEKFNDYAQKVSEFLNRSDVRTEVDDRNEKIGRKIRDNELKRIPYLLIVGEKEEAEGLVSVRAQGEGDKGQMSLEAFRDFIAGLVKEEIEANKLEKK